MPAATRSRIVRTVLFGDGRDDGGIDRLLDETRALLREAGAMVDGSIGSGRAAAADGSPTILGLYDELRLRLERVDDMRVKALLARISNNVERLGQLEREVARMRALRDRIGTL